MVVHEVSHEVAVQLLPGAVVSSEGFTGTGDSTSTFTHLAAVRTLPFLATWISSHGCPRYGRQLPQVSDETEREREGKRKGKRERDADQMEAEVSFYNLVLNVIYLYFYHTLLIDPVPFKAVNVLFLSLS